MTRLLSDIRDHLNSFFEQLVKRCPKTGRIVGVSRNSYWGAILFPVIGLAALLWFLVRVVPKPSLANLQSRCSVFRISAPLCARHGPGAPPGTLAALLAGKVGKLRVTSEQIARSS